MNGSQRYFQRKSAIVGVGSTQQGACPDRTDVQLGMEAIKAAIADAGIDKNDIDGVVTTIQRDGSGLAPLKVAQFMGLSPRVTGAFDYGTAGFTLQYAAMLVASGACEMVLCAHARNPKAAIGKLSGAFNYDAVYGLANNAGIPAMAWTQYMARYNGTPETLARVVMQSRDWASRNPQAAQRDPITMEEYFSEDPLIWPLRRIDIAKITAGAAALIVTTPDRARDMRKKPVYFEALGRQQAARALEMEDFYLSHAMRSVADQVYGAIGIKPDDIDVLGCADTHSPAIPLTLENYGFCGEGEAGAYIEAGNIGPGGKSPLNTDGGMLSSGYLVGWTHQVELVRQLRGEAGPRQVSSPKLAQYCTTGGHREHYLSTIYSID